MIQKNLFQKLSLSLLVLCLAGCSQAPEEPSSVTLPQSEEVKEEQEEDEQQPSQGGIAQSGASRQNISPEAFFGESIKTVTFTEVQDSLQENPIKRSSQSRGVTLQRQYKKSIERQEQALQVLGDGATLSGDNLYTAPEENR